MIFELAVIDDVCSGSYFNSIDTVLALFKTPNIRQF